MTMHDVYITLINVPIMEYRFQYATYPVLFSLREKENTGSYCYYLHLLSASPPSGTLWE